MMALIQNELMKVFGKIASWLYVLIIFAAVVIVGIVYLKMEGEPDPNWRQTMEEEIVKLESQLEYVSEEEKPLILQQIDEYQQYLDQNVNPNAPSNWRFMNDMVVGIGSVVTLFVVIVCSGNVSAEFSDGTIKQLLIRPHKRWSILLSKYIAVILYALLLVGTLIVSGYVVGLVLFGNGDFFAKVFEVSLEGRHAVAVGPQFFLKVFYYLPSLLMIMTIAFMLSTLFKSQALAVGGGMFVLFVSSTLRGIILLLSAKYAWAKLLIFPHLDLVPYASQEQLMAGVTLPFSLSILGIYYVLFIVATFWFFQRRDVSI